MAPKHYVLLLGGRASIPRRPGPFRARTTSSAAVSPRLFPQYEVQVPESGAGHSSASHDQGTLHDKAEFKKTFP